MPMSERAINVSDVRWRGSPSAKCPKTRTNFVVDRLAWVDAFYDRISASALVLFAAWAHRLQLMIVDYLLWRTACPATAEDRRLRRRAGRLIAMNMRDHGPDLDEWLDGTESGQEN